MNVWFKLPMLPPCWFCGGDLVKQQCSGVYSCLGDYCFVILISPPAESDLTVKNRPEQRVQHACVCLSWHIRVIWGGGTGQKRGWFEVRLAVPHCHLLVNKKTNLDTPHHHHHHHKSDVTPQLCPSSSVHVKTISLGRRHRLDPLCWFICDPHWCTSFAASCCCLQRRSR